MTRVSIDDQTRDLQTNPGQSLGDVIATLTTELAPNRVITQISLNGKQIPKYADITTLDSNAAGIDQLEIKTADRSIWAMNGIDIALNCVERVQKSLIRCAELFRGDAVGDANRFFAHCMEGMERFLETIVITRCAVRLDFNQIMAEGRPLAQVENDLLKILAGILAAQEKNDKDGIADKVEYELLPNLCSWTSALRQLRLAQRSNA